MMFGVINQSKYFIWGIIIIDVFMDKKLREIRKRLKKWRPSWMTEIVWRVKDIKYLDDFVKKNSKI